MATILTKRSNTASSVPVAGDLTNSTGGAELAVNTADKRLFTKDSGGTVVELGTNPSTFSLPNGTANGVPYLNGSKVLTSGSALTFDGTNLGLGTASPSGASGTTFAINGGAGQTRLALKNNASGDASSDGFQIALLSDGINVVYQNRESGYQSWELAGSEQMRLTSTGLGIGTSSPGYKLQVQGAGAFIGSSATNNSEIRIQNTDSGGGTWRIGDGIATANGNLSVYRTSGVLSAVFDSSGNLGLGVTPSAWYSGSKAIQVGASTSLSDLGGSYTLLGQNYKTGTSGNDIYINNGYASLYSQNGGAHRWYTAPSGTAGNAISFTQAMTLSAAGDLMVGLTSVPSLVGGGYRQLVVGGSSGGVLDVGTTTTSYGRISGNVDGLNVEALGAYPTVFRTNSTERARIDSSGNLLVGTATAGGVGFSLTDNAGAKCTTTQRASGTGATNMCLFVNPNGTVGTIQISGTSTSYNTSSDYRLKNTIAPMTGALAKVAALKPVTYKWNADGSDGEGFIAHELAEVVPQCVTGEKDAVDAEGKPVYQGIDTSFLVATLTAAIQEQQAIINQLKARLDAANL